ncbi:MAG: hypothetical protein GTO46_02550 [Gemmatimonadetes bacterium]|nr:hypothetical protein [Gemmatimonadota bacterium]NIO30661.1 hypothetical protein [Gemmatimonadota bacterium]
MSGRIQKLERDLKWLKAYAAILTCVLVFTALAPLGQSTSEDGIIRVRGLIIEDEEGRERILLGAPIPDAANRVRTDLERVREIWGSRFGERYMEFYKDYRNDMNGLLILDANGFDRIAVGDPTPDPNIGRRIAPATGIEINDEEGYERTGYGLLKVDGLYRVVLGLDSDRGTEGLTLSLFDGGKVGLSVYGERSLFLGTAPPGAMTGVSGEFHGLRLGSGDEVSYEINAAAESGAEQ